MNAEIYIVRLVQYEGAIGVATPKNLKSLDLFRDENGLIRVGGRLRHSDSITKQPVVFPRKVLSQEESLNIFIKCVAIQVVPLQLQKFVHVVIGLLA